MRRVLDVRHPLSNSSRSSRLPLPTSSHPPTLKMMNQCRHKSYVLKYLRGHLHKDLKDTQGAIGALYGALPDADEYAAFRMPSKHIEMYNQLGYVVMPHPVLSPPMVDLLVDECHQLADDVEHHPRAENLYATSLNDLKQKTLFYCQGQWRCCWGMHDLAIMPHLCVPSSQLLGNTMVRLWYDEVMMKAPRVGPCLPWTQNYARWQHTKPVNHITVMIALDTLTKDRSAPCLVPGSHRWRDGQVLQTPDYDPMKSEAQQMNQIWELVNDDEKECLMDLPPVTVELQRGQALFLHPLTLYATHQNKTLDFSRVLFVHYMGHPTFTVQPGPLLPRSTRFPPNALIHGPYFPVAFDPAMMEEPLEERQALPESTPSDNPNSDE